MADCGSWSSDERPHPRDIALYEALPNELPRVAGIISTVPQTPLSHVNLRAVQDGIPNAFIRDARDDPAIAPLIDSFVRYEVTDGGLGTAHGHQGGSRRPLRVVPARSAPDTGTRSRGHGDHTPQSDRVRGLEGVRSQGGQRRGAGDTGFSRGNGARRVCDPVLFLRRVHEGHDFYTRIETMLADPDFQTDFEVQDDMLDDLRDDIEDADSPQWIVDALTEMHATYPEGKSLRYRSSTNNEDLPGFNGAGLYDSKTQDPEETQEDGIDKSLKGCSPACGPSAPSPNASSIASITWPRQDGGAGPSQLLR